MFKPVGIFLALLIAGANAQCPPLYDYIGGRCLAFFTDVTQTFADSALTCEYFGGKLARLDDCYLIDDVAAYINDNQIDREFWIDATDVLEEGNFIWSDGTPVPMGAPFWDSRTVGGSYEPQEDDGDDCVALDPLDGFYFHNENCESSYSPLCQQLDTDSSNCSLPFVAIAGGCYEYMHAVTFTYAFARAACLNRGGDLAIIDDCSALADIIRFIEVFDESQDVWIGGQRAGTTWFWNDGTPIPDGVPFWGRDQTFGLMPDGGTSENCAYVSNTFRHRFDDISCTAELSPMCEAPVQAIAGP